MKIKLIVASLALLTASQLLGQTEIAKNTNTDEAFKQEVTSVIKMAKEGNIQAGEFLKKQAPELFEEVITYNFIKTGACFGVSLGFLGLSVFAGKQAWKASTINSAICKEKENKDYYSSEWNSK